MDAAALGVVLREVVRRNRVENGIVYLQVTRGVAPREPCLPARARAAGLVVTARPLDVRPATKRAEEGIAVITVPDNRWGRVDIKTVGLLPNVLAKQTGARGRRLRGLVRGPRRLRHRRRVDQCLDRHRRRAGS